MDVLKLGMWGPQIGFLWLSKHLTCSYQFNLQTQISNFLFSNRWRTAAAVCASGAGGSASAKWCGEPAAQERDPGEHPEVHADTQPAAVDRAAEEERVCGEGWAFAEGSGSAAINMWEKRRVGNAPEDTARAWTAEPPKSAGTETKRCFVFYF